MCYFCEALKIFHSFVLSLCSVTKGAVHQDHKGAAVQGIILGPHAVVQWSGPGGRGHPATGWSHLQGHSGQHQSF